MEDNISYSLLLKPALELPTPLAVVVLGWALLTGLTVGSFLNVVIARLPEGESVIKPRSRCPRCRTQIAWYDNVPVLSWLILRAKCRQCGMPISARYPFVEVLIGALALALVARYGLSLAALELFVFSTVLVALAFIDIDTFEVPWELLYVIAGVGLLMGGLGALGIAPTATPAWLQAALSQTGLEGLLERGIGLVAGFVGLGAVNVIFTFVFRLRGKLDGDAWAMGWGDPLLLAGMGAVLGWRALPLIVFLASVQGTVVGVLLMATGRMPGGADDAEEGGEGDGDVDVDVDGDGHRLVEEGGEDGEGEEEWTPPPTALPFVPFLALAGLEVAFFGDRVLGVISTLFGGLP